MPLQAICAACKQPLCGDLIASHCGHVFHKDCLQPTLACAKCGAPNAARGCIKLNSLSFDREGHGKQDQDDVAAILSSSCGDELKVSNAGTQDNSSIDEEEAKELLEILNLRSALREKQKLRDDMKAKLSETRAYAAMQAKKYAEAERKAQQQEKLRQKAQSDMDRQKQQYDLLCKEVQQARERDAAADYKEKLLTGSETEALNFLIDSAKFHPDPALLLTEVQRLAEHSRENQKKWTVDIQAKSNEIRQLQRTRSEQQWQQENSKEAEAANTKRRKLERGSSGRSQESSQCLDFPSSESSKEMQPPMLGDRTGSSGNLTGSRRASEPYAELQHLACEEATAGEADQMPHEIVHATLIDSDSDIL